jgi:indoleamine 2,3-dioxygenase
LAISAKLFNQFVRLATHTCFIGKFVRGAKGPEEPKWVYEGVEHSDELELSGPSAGQSSIMHAVDLFLDIDHKLRQKRYPAPSESNKRADHGFMERMRRYMPGKHREYLDHLANSPRSVRDLAERIPTLQEPYDTAVHALKKLRDQHMKIACLYIVTMARSTSARAACPVARMMDKVAAGQIAGRGPMRGTGGNELSALLKAGRDATKRAALRKA